MDVRSLFVEVLVNVLHFTITDISAVFEINLDSS